MARKKINNELWQALQPLLPTVERSPKGGRARVDDRAALNGILFVLQTGIPWEDLPQELGFGSGMTCVLMRGLGPSENYVFALSSRFEHASRHGAFDPSSSAM